MSLDLVTNTRTEAVPKTFTRGATLEFLMELPPEIPENWFNNGTTISTTLSAKLRLKDQAGEDGLIADLNPTWESDTNYTKIRFLVSDTSAFPLGAAEFDVLFTKTKTGTGAYVKKYRSQKVAITIEDGVS